MEEQRSQLSNIVAVTRDGDPVKGPRLNIGVFGARGIPSTYGGYETFLTTLLPQLAARGHDVTMYCRRGEIGGSGPFEGVRRVMVPTLHTKNFDTLSHGLVCAVRARAARHDVLLVVNVANALFCAFNSNTGQPTVLNVDGQEWLRDKWGGLAKRFFHFSASFAKHGATGLIADCRAMADVYRSAFRADSTVIPYCLPLTAPERDGTMPARFGVVRGEYFVVAGRLNPENNMDRVAAEYAASTLPYPLLVLGRANYRSPVAEALERLSAEDSRICLVGHVSDRPGFLDLISGAAGYIHAHSVGGMNPALVEAMHAGAMVIALGTSFNRETLGPSGLYFAFGGAGGPTLCDTLRSIQEMTEGERCRRRQAATARAGDLYNVDDVVDAYERLLVLASARSSRGRLVMPTRWNE